MYGRTIEIYIKGGGVLNRIRWTSEEDGIAEAKRTISRWYRCDQFADKSLRWRFA